MRKAVLIFLVFILLCGCASVPAPEETADSSEPAEQADVGFAGNLPVRRASENNLSESKSKLTGFPIDEKIANRRPVAVMINNLKKSLPQYGISRASIVFEALAEGGITRLLAVFEDYDSVEQIGTVRSARPYYIDMAQSVDAVYIHIGGSPDAYKQLSSRSVASFDLISGANNSMYWRDKSRIKSSGYEHSVFTSGERIAGQMSRAGYRTERNENYGDAFNFSSELNGEATSAISATVKYSNYKTGEFKYAPPLLSYTVSQYGAPHIDALTGNQLAFQNVFILTINSYVLDSYGRLGMDIVGSGSGIYMTRGKSVEIKWSRKKHSSPFSFTTLSGEPLNVLCGKSYVAIVARDTEVEITGAPETAPTEQPEG